MMMILGMFVFGLKTVPYQSFTQTKNYRFGSNNRIGLPAALQFLGNDNDTITLSGVLMPEITGGRVSMLMLKIMADFGKAWPLIERSGVIYGMYVIESITETKTEFFPDGMARKIEFSITLKRADTGLLDMFKGLNERLAGLL